MAYTTIDDPTIYFNTKLTTGTGSSQAVTGLGFQPDWIWGKRRDSTGHNSLFDSVRGITKGLEANQTGAEFTSTDYYSSFDSDGFTIAAGAAGAGNGSSQTAVQWCWKAGTSFSNDASATSVGDIDSSGSVNTDAGFSICSFTGNGSNSQTVKHGLSTAPELIILKARGQGTYGWVTYDAINGAGKYLTLNNTHGAVSDTGMWSNTAPTSSVFSLSNGDNTVATNPNTVTMISYCFHSVKGYSKIGSFTGNGSASSGPFVYLGFRPAWVMIKRSGGTGGWEIYDSKRDGFNPQVHGLTANTNNAEDNTDDLLDLLSNGFKLYHDGSGLNTDGSEYIYMAFAEAPLVNSNGIPNNAR